MGDHTGGIESYSQALAINPTSTRALIEKGSFWKRWATIPEGLESYGKALGHKPHQHKGVDRQKADLEKMGDHTGVIESYGKALAINPTSTRALIEKGGFWKRWVTTPEV